MLVTMTHISSAQEKAGHVSVHLTREEQLVRNAQNGDVWAFNELVRAYQSLAYHIAYRVLADGEVAADATQEAFILAYKHIGAFRGGSFKAWLLRIVTNSCYSQLRTKQRKPVVSLDSAVEPDKQRGRLQARDESPEDYAERRELNATIQQGLKTLPNDQRMTLVLSDIEGLSYKEIAVMTGTNMGTVKSRLARARALLRDYLLAQESVLPGANRRAGL
ncbi:MAG: sigma-70 family RNA polymerase sigma factor [Rudaea sp.]